MVELGTTLMYQQKLQKLKNVTNSQKWVSLCKERENGIIDLKVGKKHRNCSAWRRTL